MKDYPDNLWICIHYGPTYISFILNPSLLGIRLQLGKKKKYSTLIVDDMIKFCLHFQIYALYLHQKDTFKSLTIYSPYYLKPVIDLTLCSPSIFPVVLLFIGPETILQYSVKIKSLYYLIVSDYFSINFWNLQVSPDQKMH